MNTRKYPRTLNEAFQHTADYACSIERGQRKDNFTNTVSVIAIVALFVIIAILG